LNLSALSLGDPELYDDFASAIATSAADPGHIVIELTETALMQDEVMAAACCARTSPVDYAQGYEIGRPGPMEDTLYKAA
jgi:EAL domain-containing protein (putative c-di-GMP-specific phosphodiesterase class I)